MDTLLFYLCTAVACVSLLDCLQMVLCERCAYVVPLWFYWLAALLVGGLFILERESYVSK